MRSTANRNELFLDIFNTRLGWMGIVGSDQVLRQLRFGEASPDALVRSLKMFQPHAEVRSWWPALAKRLKRFAEGETDDFADVEVVYPPASTFRTRVREECRKIPYGATMTYGELAAACGAERAARAVGTVMRENLTPLVVPCHRVVRSGGLIGNYSGGGANAKRRLLALEARGVCSGRG